nr:C618 [uncultured bacterium]ART37221.1 D472 [uncultured bacterium]
MTTKLGPNVTMKNEGREAWIDDSVVLALDGTRIVSVTDGTCD